MERVEEFDTEDNLLWRTVYDYDIAGRVIRKSVPIGTITYTYDHTGTLVGMQSTAGHNMRYEYNQRGQLSAVYQNGELLSALDYDVAGRLASRTHGPNATSTYTYDCRHQPTDVVTETAHGDYTQTYTYYDDGYIEWHALQWESDAPWFHEYLYDGLGRLTDNVDLVEERIPGQVILSYGLWASARAFGGAAGGRRGVRGGR